MILIFKDISLPKIKTHINILCGKAHRHSRRRKWHMNNKIKTKIYSPLLQVNSSRTARCKEVRLVILLMLKSVNLLNIPSQKSIQTIKKDNKFFRNQKIKRDKNM